MRIFLTLLVILLGAAAIAVYTSAFVVHQNEQVLVLEFGNHKRTINSLTLQAGEDKVKTGPGLYWKLPFVQTVIYFDKRILDLNMQPQEVTASDQKRIVVDAFARYRIVDPLLFYQAVTNEANVRARLGPITESALRRVLSAATFQELVRDKRQDLMGRIATQVNQEGKGLGIEIVDVRIKRADLPEQNEKSVFERMRSERQRIATETRAEGNGAANRIKATADRDVTIIKAEATRKSEQIKGEGDAERNRIFADAYQRDPDFFGFYRSMQAYELGLKPGETRMVISPDSEFFRYFTNPSGLPTLPPPTTPKP